MNAQAWRRLLVRLLATFAGAIAAAGLALVASPAPALAATCDSTWTNPVSGAWSDPSMWTGPVPDAGKNVCITVAGTYTVTASDGFDSALGLTLGGSSGTQTLVAAANTDFGINAASTITGNGVLVLGDGSSNNQTILAGGPSVTLTNHGNIDLVAGLGGYRNIQLVVDNATDGTFNVGANAIGGNQGVGFINEGALNINSSGGNFSGGNSNGSSFTNASGTIANPTGGTFYFNNYFYEGNGATTGTPLFLNGSTLTFTGSGASSFTMVNGFSHIYGNMVFGQSVAIDATGGYNSVGYDVPAGGATMGGALSLINTVSPGSTPTDYFHADCDSCNPGDQLVLAGSLTVNAPNTTVQMQGYITNTGTTTIISNFSNGLQGFHFTNAGAFNVNSGATFGQCGCNSTDFTNASGTITNNGSFNYGGFDFYQGNGTTAGANPLYLNVGRLHYTGTGASSYDMYNGGQVIGDMAAGQLLALDANSGYTSVGYAAPATMGGTLSFVNTGGGAGSTVYLHEDNTVTNTDRLTITGTVLANSQGAQDQLSGRFTSTGTLNIESTVVFLGGTDFANSGAINVNDGVSLVSTGQNSISLTNDGTITLASTAGMSWQNQFVQNADGTFADNIVDGPSFGQVTGCGNFSLAGTLKVTTVGVPPVGSAWPIFQLTDSGGNPCNNFAGTQFASETYVGFNAWTVQYPSNGVTLVALAQSTTATAVFDASGSSPWSGTEVADAQTYDTATVTGSTPTPSGTLTYSFFGTGNCTGTPASTQTVTLNADGSAPNSSTTAALAPGSYAYLAAYSGDSNYGASSATCEVFSVAKASPTLATKLSAGSITAGQSASDSATFTGFATGGAASAPPAIEAAAYFIYSDSGCSQNQQEVGGFVNVNPANGAVPDSASMSFSNAGTYYWQAVYSGDSYNNSAKSPCNEVLIVTANQSAPISQITETATTCSQFSTATATTLSGVNYMLQSPKKGGASIFQVSPGVFYYWVTVTASGGAQSFTITQGESETSRPFLLSSGSNAYTSGCATVSGTKVSQSAATGTVTVALPKTTKAGTYYLGVKFSTANVVGEARPTPSTSVTYSFNTPATAGSTSSLVLSKK